MKCTKYFNFEFSYNHSEFNNNDAVPLEPYKLNNGFILGTGLKGRGKEKGNTC